MNTFYNQMFNPQYVNLQYFRQIEQLQYEAKQKEEVAKAVNAIHDLCEAVKQLDDHHQQIAFSAYHRPFWRGYSFHKCDRHPFRYPR